MADANWREGSALESLSLVASGSLTHREAHCPISALTQGCPPTLSAGNPMRPAIISLNWAARLGN
jgi:hypothetical protein